ncbi:unnamed protein product [Cuscuta epithymum]|uniref:Dof zinc finger protein n=1 Tax=Cuscuta epithymum TaxID=186058 RepID=A0AAV0CHE2_9ASTE|nr:unnamed protein product [Cuscuta epithymum]
MDRIWKSNIEIAPNCPRCASTHTKFCYYNNYSLSQPRYFCKGCRRYWTKGGSLRNVPVGGGCRKGRRSSKPASRPEAERPPYRSPIATSPFDALHFPGESTHADHSGSGQRGFPPAPMFMEQGEGSLHQEAFINGGEERVFGVDGCDRNELHDELQALLLGEDGGQWSTPEGPPDMEWQPPVMMMMQPQQVEADFGTFVGGDVDCWTGARGSTCLAAAAVDNDDVWGSYDLSSGSENFVWP